MSLRYCWQIPYLISSSFEKINEPFYSAWKHQNIYCELRGTKSSLICLNLFNEIYWQSLKYIKENNVDGQRNIKRLKNNKEASFTAYFKVEISTHRNFCGSTQAQNFCILQAFPLAYDQILKIFQSLKFFKKLKLKKEHDLC